jgi:hypothetical protein
MGLARTVRCFSFGDEMSNPLGINNPLRDVGGRGGRRRQDADDDER